MKEKKKQKKQSCPAFCINGATKAYEYINVVQNFINVTAVTVKNQPNQEVSLKKGPSYNRFLKHHKIRYTHYL